MTNQRERPRLASVPSTPLTVAAGVVSLDAGPQPYTMTDADRDRYLASASASDLAGAITRPSGDESERYRDRGPGHAAGWSGRQQAAARRLEMAWRQALPVSGPPKGFASGCSPRGSLSDQEAEEATRAWHDYRTAMDEVIRQCGHAHAEALRMAIVYGEAMPLYRAWRVREGLTALAIWWGIK